MMYLIINFLAIVTGFVLGLLYCHLKNKNKYSNHKKPFNKWFLVIFMLLCSCTTLPQCPIIDYKHLKTKVPYYSKQELEELTNIVQQSNSRILYQIIYDYHNLRQEIENL